MLLAALDDPGLPARLATSFAARAASTDADTVNRELWDSAATTGGG